MTFQNHGAEGSFYVTSREPSPNICIVDGAGPQSGLDIELGGL
jgi:hypothetical protein